MSFVRKWFVSEKKKKKKDKISLDSKLLTKLMCDAGNSNDGNLFVQKPQTRTMVFKGFHLPPTATAAIGSLKL